MAMKHSTEVILALLSVLALPVLNHAHDYLGCFYDGEDRALDGFEKKGDKTMTTEKCVSMCQQKGFKYAGIEYSNECFCGNSYGKHGKASEDHCSMECAGDIAQLCGGSWAFSLYALQPTDQPFKPLDCYDVLKAGNNRSGIYLVYPSGVARAVYCDQETSGGGWLVFQRRRDGSEDFYRGWYDYQRGFGHLSNEFWIGNQFLNTLTSQRPYTVRVDMESFENKTEYATYEDFSIGDASQKYAIHLGKYHGTAGDSLTHHNGRPFTTKDQDNDSFSKNCAVTFKGAWWYKSCHESNLNGLYKKGHHESFADGVNWEAWKGYFYSLKVTEMKCRPALL